MDKPLEQDAQFENALKSEPLAPMPRGITLDVMARIQSMNVRRPAIITWSDFGLSSVLAACVAAIWFASQHLPPLLVAKMRIQGILLYQAFRINERWLVPTIFFGLAALAASLTIPTLIRTLSQQKDMREAN